LPKQRYACVSECEEFLAFDDIVVERIALPAVK
jgi:hypothetical protein